MFLPWLDERIGLQRDYILIRLQIYPESYIGYKVTQYSAKAI